MNLLFFKQNLRPVRRPFWLAAALLALSAAIWLFTGFTMAKNTFLITDGDLLYTVENFSGTLDEAVTRAGITLSSLDRVEAAPGASPVRASVIRTTISQVTTYESIPHQSIRRANPALPTGTERVLQQGADGRRALSTEVTTVSGRAGEVSFYGVNILTAPVDEIVEYGTGLPAVRQSWLSVSADPLAARDEEQMTIITASGNVLSFSSVLSVTATAYTTERQAWKLTATGTTARVGAIAVDPKVIPYGTRLYIVSADGSITYGVATAEDCGGSIKGNKIDLFFNTYDECIQFGRRPCTVYILS